MKELEKLMENVKDTIEKTNNDIREGEPYMKDPILHQFYEGKIPALRKKKQDLVRILKELEKIAVRFVDSAEESDEEVEEDIIEDV